jgi:pilus assembly protein Flp/PilA
MLTKMYTTVMSRIIYLKSRRGQTLVEYGLILALVSIVVIAVLTLLGNQLKNVFSKITNTLRAA